jgi:hypothetical protein
MIEAIVSTRSRSSTGTPALSSDETVRSTRVCTTCSAVSPGSNVYVAGKSHPSIETAEAGTPYAVGSATAASKSATGMSVAADSSSMIVAPVSPSRMTAVRSILFAGSCSASRADCALISSASR